MNARDTTSSDARTCVDYSDKHGGTYRETCRGETDSRIQGLLHSAVQEHDHIRKQAGPEIDTPVRESTRTKKQCKQTYNKIARSIRSASQSKEMIHIMGNMEYFEILRDHSKHTGPKAIVYCTCGTCLKTLRQSSKTQQRPL